MSNVFRGVRRFALAASLACIIITLSPAAHGQGFTITNLTNNSASSASFPSMAIDSGGNLNLVWVDNNKGLQFLLSTSSSSGTSFGTPPTPTTIPGSNGQALPFFQPQIALYLNSGGPTRVEIVWAAKDPAWTAAAPLYDVFTSRSDQAGAVGTFVTKTIAGPSPAPGPPLALFDSPRLAFDHSGRTNVVWGQHDVLISQAQDGINFGAPVSLVQPGTPAPDTGGPRIAVSADNHIFVVWTDESGKSLPGPTNYCNGEILVNGVVQNTTGGRVWVNETVPSGGLSNANTRSLSDTDWKGPSAKFANGFFACSYDNLSMFADKVGHIHLLWSNDSPFEDVLTSEPHGLNAQGYLTFSFPINLANVSAASPQAAVDKNGSFYVTWSGGPNGDASSQGIYFTRSDDGGSTFTTPSCPNPNPTCPAQNIAPKATAPAFPQVAVDANSNVNIVWEQASAPLKYNGTDMFDVFLARSTDRGNTFPTVLPVSTNSSVFCFSGAPAPEGPGGGAGTPTPTTPDVSTCGTVQIAMGPNSSPEMAWVNQPNANAAADIDFATTTFPSGSVAPATANLSASTPSANFTVTVNGFSGSVNLSCLDADTNAALPTWLTCTFAQNPLNTSQGNTDTLTITRAGTPTSSMLISAPRVPIAPPYSGPAAVSLIFAALSLIAMVALFIGRRQQTTRAFFVRGLAVMALTIVLATVLVSCGGTTSTTSSTATTGTSGSSGTGGSGGTGGTGGTGGNTVTVHVSVLAQSGSGSSTNLGTVAITAQ